MTNVIDFPRAQVVEVINEAYFEQFEDAALMLMSFEKLADAVEVVSEGSAIHERDETHVGLMEACMALAVMFRRRTGFDVQQVSAEHLEEERRRLLGGEELQSLPIPIKAPVFCPLPPSAFNHLPDLELAQSGFGYISRTHEHLQKNAPSLNDLDFARAHTLDAMNAFSLLITRLAGAALSGKGSNDAKVNAPGSETLQ